ncbi:receptor-like protein kinase [Camellia sinensis]|uniref:receptor-like protein kinase n=1 Tax=Camellia sinensis TaxID=4442 RepID=UPI0010357DB9|nr:receptor-like protein kinase [Camellia sinensis]
MTHWTSIPPSMKSSWNASDSTYRSWVGVECDSNHHHNHFVVSLNLSCFQILGRLGPEIAELTQLNLIEYLELSQNNFTGDIPESFGNLLNLRFINLYSSLMKGLIPESLFRIPHLDTVWLDVNELNGSIPLNVGNMSEIETDAYALWTKLEGMYQSKTAWNKALLMRRLVNLKLKGGISVAEHTSEFQNLVNQLATVKMELDDEMQALLLLSSLPDSWETLVVSLNNSAPEGKLTMSMVTDALFSEEARKKEMGGDQSHALVTENKG